MNSNQEAVVYSAPINSIEVHGAYWSKQMMDLCRSQQMPMKVTGNSFDVEIGTGMLTFARSALRSLSLTNATSPNLSKLSILIGDTVTPNVVDLRSGEERGHIVSVSTSVKIH